MGLRTLSAQWKVKYTHAVARTNTSSHLARPAFIFSTMIQNGLTLDRRVAHQVLALPLRRHGEMGAGGHQLLLRQQRRICQKQMIYTGLINICKLDARETQSRAARR